jgi:hypothetical protein
MASTATVRRPGGTTTNAGGFKVDAWTDVHTDIPFRLGGKAQFSGETRSVTVGDVELTLAVRVGHFAADTTGLADGDMIEVTGGENAGAFLRIVEASWQDQATARRVPVVEAQRPGGWT